MKAKLTSNFQRTMYQQCVFLQAHKQFHLLLSNHLYYPYPMFHTNPLSFQNRQMALGHWYQLNAIYQTIFWLQIEFLHQMGNWTVLKKRTNKNINSVHLSDYQLKFICPFKNDGLLRRLFYCLGNFHKDEEMPFLLISVRLFSSCYIKFL